MTDSITGLGTYMRSVGKALRPDDPMNSHEAYHYVAYQDRGYAAAVLIRLEERGIAKEIPGGFVRGPRWEETATYYGWTP